MKLLLDTHAWLWFRTASPRLGARAHELMVDPANDVIVSVASVWEVGIKAEAGKLALPQPFEAWVDAALAGFDVLAITLAHVRIAARLPLHHKDPFDRALVAQAHVDGLTLLTADPLVQRYGGALLRADL